MRFSISFDDGFALFRVEQVPTSLHDALAALSVSWDRGDHATVYVVPNTFYEAAYQLCLRMMP